MLCLKAPCKLLKASLLLSQPKIPLINYQRSSFQKKIDCLKKYINFQQYFSDSCKKQIFKKIENVFRANFTYLGR